MCEPAPACAAAALLELCRPAVARGSARRWMLLLRSPRVQRGRGRGEALAHARVAVGGSGRRMRALSQKPGTPRGARPHSRAHAGAGRGFPACARCQSRSGACARYLRPTGGAGSLRSRPPPHPAPSSRHQSTGPFVSPRNGAGTIWGRAPWTRLALGLALSATARLAPPRALPQSVAPKAPLSGGGGSCFRFFLSVQSGVASSTQPPLPLPQRGAAAAEGCGFGSCDGERRRPPLLPPRVRGRFGSRAPRASGSWAGLRAGSEEAPRLSLLVSPGDPRACCCNCCRLTSGFRKSGEGAPRTLWRMPWRSPGGAGRG